MWVRVHGVRVEVKVSEPSPNPYPQCRWGVTHSFLEGSWLAVIVTMENWSWVFSPCLECNWAPQFPCTQESKLTASGRRQGSFSWGWYVATSRNYNIAAQPFLNRPGFNRSLWGCGPLWWSNTNICTQMNHQQQPCMVTTMATPETWPCDCCCHVNWHLRGGPLRRSNANICTHTSH